MAKAKVRGSARLPARVTRADLDRILAAAQIEGVDLVDFFPYGIPAPDGGWGTWHASPGAVAGLINQLLRNRVVPAVTIFPKGIPVPDLFEVTFELGSARTLKR